MSGYARRFAGSYGDQMMGNMMTEGIVPSLLHQDRATSAWARVPAGRARAMPSPASSWRARIRATIRSTSRNGR